MRQQDQIICQRFTKLSMILKDWWMTKGHPKCITCRTSRVLVKAWLEVGMKLCNQRLILLRRRGWGRLSIWGSSESSSSVIIKVHRGSKWIKLKHLERKILASNRNLTSLMKVPATLWAILPRRTSECWIIVRRKVLWKSTLWIEASAKKLKEWKINEANLALSLHSEMTCRILIETTLTW